MAAKKHICVVTGSRAEFGLLRSVMHAIRAHSRLSLQVVVAGMHLSPKFGLTVRDVEKTFAVSARVPMTPAEDSPQAMARSVGVGVDGMTKAFTKLRPDVVVVLGDRVEAFAATIAAAYMGIPLAHIHGGDRSGTIDESARHAITKLAHIHFPASKKSAERILRMGEERWRIHMTGAPGLDGIQPSATFKKTVLKKYKLGGPFILLVQHPDTTDQKSAVHELEETLKALGSFSLPVFALYPNADSGGRTMAALLEKHAAAHTNWILQKSLPRDEYLALLASATVLVGNSSSGMIEAPFLKVPVVNIGDRQIGREHGGSVRSVSADRRAIARAIRAALATKKTSVRNPYGAGHAGKRIAAVLASLSSDPKLLQKGMTY